jgi:hypothetical protein
LPPCWRIVTSQVGDIFAYLSLRKLLFWTLSFFHKHFL